MGIESLLVRLRGRPVTSITLTGQSDVIAEPALPLTSTPITSITPENHFESFFICAEQLKLSLLLEDKQWLRGVCQDMPLQLLQQLLTCYIEVWLNAMNQEKEVQRKQSRGRYAANSKVREALSS